MVVERIERQPTAKGPAEMFTGDVYFNAIARGEGVGIVATRDRVIVMRPGDTVHTPPEEGHRLGDEEYDAAVQQAREV